MIFSLPPDLPFFPHPSLANEDGLLATGSNLKPRTLLNAYSFGIFPWFNEEDPILWWSPHPRCVLFPHKIRISKSMRSFNRKTDLKCTMDLNFADVIQHCSDSRIKNGEGTWLHPELIESFTQLHKMGHARSVEVWQEDHLVGGLYGLQLGKVFFGESMFSYVSNASKLALIHLCQQLTNDDFLLIDCQQATDHLISMGAEEIDQNSFLGYLKENHSAICRM